MIDVVGGDWKCRWINYGLWYIYIYVYRTSEHGGYFMVFQPNITTGAILYRFSELARFPVKVQLRFLSG